MDLYDKDLSDDNDDNDDDYNERGLLWGQGWTRAREMIMIMNSQKLMILFEKFQNKLSKNHPFTINFCIVKLLKFKQDLVEFVLSDV